MTKDVRIGLLIDYGSDFAREIYRGVLCYARTVPNAQVVRMSGGIPDQDVKWSRVPSHIIGQFSNPEGIQVFLDRGRKVVNIFGRIPDPKVPTVRIDDVAVGRMAADYFLARGFRHFAFRGFDQVAFSELRWEGFRERLEEQEIVPVESIVHLRGDSTRMSDLPGLPHPCAVLCATDLVGSKVIQGCMNLGISVPESLSILGVDNDEFLSEGLAVPLSSIDVGARKIGFEAARLVHASPRNVLSPPLILQPPLGVIERKSSDLMAVSDPLVAEVLRRIRSRHREFVLIPDLIEDLPIQRRMLERRFSQATGRSMHQELRRLRFEAAKDLLVHSDLPVEHIAESTAIGESRQLSAMFKKELGMTPTAWRNQYQFR